MNLSRRGFLKALSVATAAAVAAEVDPEFLLWRPGQKTIFLPPPPQVYSAEMLQLEMSRLYRALTLDVFKQTGKRVSQLVDPLMPANLSFANARPDPRSPHWFYNDPMTKRMVYLGTRTEADMFKLVKEQKHLDHTRGPAGAFVPFDGNGLSPRLDSVDGKRTAWVAVSNNDATDTALLKFSRPTARKE